MTRREKFVLLSAILIVALSLPLLSIFFWLILWFLAWYIKKIPERRLPLAAFFATHQSTFYHWTSDFLYSWLAIPRLIFLIFFVLVVLLWLLLFLRLLPPPWSPAQIQIVDAKGSVISYSTTGTDEPRCFDGLAPGVYTVSETDPPGLVSSTVNIITMTVRSGVWHQVAFGDLSPTSTVTRNLDLTTTRTIAQGGTNVGASPSSPGAICVSVWHDKNANGFRDAGEPLLPEGSPLQWLATPGAFWIASIVFLMLNLLGLWLAYMGSWQATLWQAEPTAHALLGNEFDKLTEKEKKELYKHIAEVTIGINKGTWIVKDGKAEVKNAPADTFAKFGGPGVLIVQEGHVAVLERGGRISGMVGAGYHRLKPFERVHMVVYLPIRVEKVNVEDALTADKMVLRKFELLVFHRADRGDRSESSGQYRYDPKVIRELIWSPKADDWRDTVKSIADNAARDVIAQYNFEDLVSISGEARRKLIDELTARINLTTKGFLGIEVAGTNIGAILISEEAKRALEAKMLSEVERQGAVVNAEAEKEALARKGEGQAIAIRRLEQEKAAIRAELIKQLMEPLKLIPPQVLSDPEVAKQVVTAVERLLERLETSMVRDDLDLLRYSEMLEKMKDVEGPKTVIFGDTKGMTTSMDVQPK